MSEENSLRFWIIPIVSMVCISVFLAGVIINHSLYTIPLAEKQAQEIAGMSCEEIENFSSDNVLYTPSTRQLFADSTEGCAEAAKAVKAKQNELLKEKLKDPTSTESLLKEFKKQSSLQDTLQKDYDHHFDESEKLYLELTDANNKIAEIQSQDNWSEVEKRLDAEKIQ
ncbi:MAG: hypothetical protein GKS07_08330 [Nitrosopumilus sp.]|nr:MAG: hypothetical protein GKS07_08330 [Nitrosopumilus sp.]